MIDTIGLEVPILFFFIAMFYASVGFGGGSSYQALLALLGIDHVLLRFIALACNLVVVSSGTYLFFKRGYLDMKGALPLTFVSIPAAYLGGRITLAEDDYFILLACVLIASSLLLFFYPQAEPRSPVKGAKFFIFLNGFIGGSLGFLAGLVGIGGGIFLAPVLHLMRWNRAKVIAATSSFFILVNSAAGLLGQYSQQSLSLPYDMVFYCMLSVFLGGQIGTRLSIGFFGERLIKRITALFTLLVAIRLLIKYL